MRMLGVFALLVTSILSSGCGGTDSGNPPPPASTGSSSDTGVASIENYICYKLSACFSLEYESCYSGLRASSGIDTEIGLASGYGTFQKIITDDGAGTITRSASALTTCTAAIYTLTCSSTAVQTSFSSGTPTDFSNIQNILPTGSGSCPDIY